MKIKIIIIFVSLVFGAIVSYLTFNIKSTSYGECHDIVYSGWPFKSIKLVNFKECNILTLGTPEIGPAFPFIINMIIFFASVFLIFCGFFHRQIPRLKPFISKTLILAFVLFSLTLVIIVNS